MAKYSYEFKKKLVQEYLDEKGGYKHLTKKYNLGTDSQIRRWIAAYREFGDDGLRRSRKNTSYSFEFKLHVVELYLSSEIPYQELSLSQGINNPAMIVKWVNDFRVVGPDALRPKKKGRKKILNQLEEKMLEIHVEHKDYGYRRMKVGLCNRGYLVNKKKVQKLMRRLNLQVTSFTRKSHKYSSYRGKIGTVAPNTIRRRFRTNIPHQKITTDTTEFKYYEIDDKGHMMMQKLYFGPFMDICNGEIISFGIDKRPSAQSVMNALEEAISITIDCPYRRTFHSDQGWAYQMKAYSRRLKEERIFQSMSRKGNFYDNSVMENFFGLLKQKIYYVVVYYSYDELKEAIEKYVKYYNEKRIKEKLGWLTPVQYRQHLLAA